MQLQLYGNKIWLFRKHIDFRLAIDGLSALVVNKMQHNPQTDIYLFFNKRKDRIKILSWHKNGFAFFYKRIEVGKFVFEFNKQDGAIEMNMDELSWLLAGLEWQKMSKWKELSYEKFD